MPQLAGVTGLGDNLGVSVGQATVSSVALWFPRPHIAALLWRQVGTLRLCQSDASRLIIVKEWPIVYPGIWPIYNVSQDTLGLQWRFTCIRPNLAYQFYWA